MFIHYRTQGFVFKKSNRREADQILTLYTKDFGRLEILGRAIRKISSKLRSGAELFYLSEVEFIQGRAQKTLTDAVLINRFGNIRKDLSRLIVVYRILEVFDELVQGQDPDPGIWQLLLDIFKKLNEEKFKIKNYSLIYYYFLWNFFSVLGYYLELYKCFYCQEKISPSSIYFCPKEGGIVCERCFKKNVGKKGFKKEDWQAVDLATVKILRIILKRDWDIFARLKVESSHLLELKNISQKFLSFHF